MVHIKMSFSGQEILVFFESHFSDVVPVAMETIMKHISDARVKQVVDKLGLVNITDKEATLFSLDGSIISVPL